MSVWGRGRRLADFEGDERERVLTEDGWLRFAARARPREPPVQRVAVQAPAARAALRRGVRAASPGSRASPSEPADVLEDFRAFLAHARRARRPRTSTGRVQHDLVSAAAARPRRARRADGRDARAAARARRRRAWPEGGTAREPQRPAAAAGGVRRGGRGGAAPRVRARLRGVRLRRRPRRRATSRRGRREVRGLLPGLRDAIDRHERIGHLHRARAEARTAGSTPSSSRVEEIRARQVGRARLRGPDQPRGRTTTSPSAGAGRRAGATPGFTAVVRVRNEARSLPWVLPPLLRAVDRVVLVDNGSTDGTRGRRAARRRRARRRRPPRRPRLPVRDRALRRRAPRHARRLGAQPHLLLQLVVRARAHRLRAQVGRRHGAHRRARPPRSRDLAWQLEADQAIVRVPRHPLYVVDDRVAFVDLELRNNEPWGWPNRRGYSFAKALEWELPMWPPDLPQRHAARVGLRRAQVPRRRRVRALVADGLRRLAADAAQAARVGGVPRAGGRRARRRRASWRVRARRPAATSSTTSADEWLPARARGGRQPEPAHRRSAASLRAEPPAQAGGRRDPRQVPELLRIAAQVVQLAPSAERLDVDEPRRAQAGEARRRAPRALRPRALEQHVARAAARSRREGPATATMPSGSHAARAPAAARIVGARSPFQTSWRAHRAARHAGAAQQQRHADRGLVGHDLPARDPVLAAHEPVVGREDDDRVVELAGRRAAPARSARRPRRRRAATRAGAGGAAPDASLRRRDAARGRRSARGLSDTSASS